MAAKPQNLEMIPNGQIEKQIQEQIEILCKKHKIKPAIYAGACAMNDWRPGKVLTEKEFLDGIAAFNQMPMNYSQRKERGGK